MSDLVYTCVFDDYDWVLPPLGVGTGVHHVLVTDKNGPEPDGWERRVVDPSRWGGAAAANRYWKMLGHRELPGFTRSLYVDANIRLLGDSVAFLDMALPDGAAMGLFRHPLRNSVAAEMKACLDTGKIADATQIEAERKAYLDLGFPDDVGLSENTILARRPGAPGLDAAMHEWWDMYRRFKSRDQFSLPVIRWRHDIPVHWLDWSFRNPNPWFAIYAHRKGRNVNPRFAWMEARAHDSAAHAALLRAWKMYRTVKRTLGADSSTRSLPCRSRWPPYH